MLSFKSRKVEQPGPAQTNSGPVAPSRMISNSEMIELLAAENISDNKIEKTSEDLIEMLKSISDPEERSRKVNELKNTLELLVLEKD